MAELTKDQIADYKRQFTSWYRTIMKRDINVPPSIMKEALKQRMPAAQFQDYVRRHDKNWLKTTEAMNRIRDVTYLFRQTLGPDWYKAGKKMDYRKLAEKYARADPGRVNMLRGIFRGIIMKNPLFEKRHPMFRKWYNKNYQQIMDGRSVLAWLRQYDSDLDSARNSYQQAYSNIMGADQKLPEKLLEMAFNNDWDANGPDFIKAIQDGTWSTNKQGEVTELPDEATAYEQGQYAKNRNAEFTAKWTDIFGDEVAIDKTLLSKYVRSTDEFEDFFDKEIKNSEVFTNTFPDYSEFEDSQHAQGREDIDIWDYFDKRTEFLEDYRETFGDVNIDGNVLARALREGWSVATWHKFVMENDARAVNTTEFKNKAESFDEYWRNVFGPNSAIDPAMRKEFVTSGLASPQQMWSKMKGTQAFKEQYKNWDVYEETQAARGTTNIINDPSMYKEYVASMKDAWAKYGMQMPEGYERTFFASGLTPDEVDRNLDLYSNTNLSYKWGTGAGADVATVAGTQNKVAGGDLRKRMEKALQQHQRYAASDFNRFRTEENQSSELIRKI